MSSPAFAAPLTLSPRFSKRLALLLALVHGGALAALAFPPLALPATARGLLALIVCLHAWRAARHHLLLRHPDLPAELVLHAGQVVLGDGRTAKIAPDTYVHPQLVVLNLRLPGGRRASRVLLPDALDPVTFRRLRVLLRHAAGHDLNSAAETATD